MRVVVTEFMDEAALGNFGDGISVTYDPSLVDDRGGILAAVSDADAIIVRNRTCVIRKLRAAAPRPADRVRLAGTRQVAGRHRAGVEDVPVPAHLYDEIRDLFVGK